MQQVPFEGCHTYYREAKEDHKAIWKSMFKTRNSYQEKPEEKKQVTMALKKQIKRGGKSDNTKETK